MLQVDPKSIPNLENLSAVSEQGMYGDLGLRDPNVKKVKKKDRRDNRVSDTDDESEN